MLGSALEPIQISSDLESGPNSPIGRSILLSEPKLLETEAVEIISISTGSPPQEVLVNGGAVLSGHENFCRIVGNTEDHSVGSVKLPQKDLTGGSAMHGAGRQSKQVVELDSAPAPAVTQRGSASDVDELESPFSSPLSSLSSLPPSGPLTPMHSAIPPEAPAESSKAALERTKKPKAAPKRKVNANGVLASKKNSSAMGYSKESQDDYSYLDPSLGLLDDDEDDDYRPSGKQKAKGSKGPRKPPIIREALAPSIPSRTVVSETQVLKLLKGKSKEVQMGNCQRPRYAKWGKCTQCIAKAGGDSCRFKDLRSFPLDPNTAEIIGPGYFEDSTLKDAMTELPTDLNAPETMEAVERTEHTVAPILLPVLFTELRHIIKYNAIRREVDSAKHRALCDFCNSTIFAGYFFCKHCGRDFCLQCERYFSNDEHTMSTSPWPLRPEARPRLQRCSARAAISRSAGFHYRPDLQPVSRFGREELETHCEALTSLILREHISTEEKLRILGIEKDDPTASEISNSLSDSGHHRNGVAQPMDLASLYTTTTNPGVPLPSDPAELQSHSHSFMCLAVDDLHNSNFDHIWARGEPIVVTNVDKRLQLQWTPETIIEKFGSEHCVLVDCQTNRNVLSTVGLFFSGFLDVEARSPGIWKLKDWPATEDFKLTHPGLYNDFCDALPVPDYTRREGIMNLYAHFPTGPTKPDIGPKMYNAFTAVETPGGFGSTRLHMDVADAINLMLYASPGSDGTPGCAVWDLFRAEDADKIRFFLFQKFGHNHAFTDPIHAQLFYLDSGLRRELWEEHGVTSFRIYQYPGQCVFIPAGCAHQVCNLADCIKIALDFVSPHNVPRCQRLTSDFRNENFAKAWKEDVLQLYNVLWYSWLWTREARMRLDNKSAPGQATDGDLDTSGWRGANLSSLRDHLDNGKVTTGDSSLVDPPLKTPHNGQLDPACQAICSLIMQHAINRPDPPPLTEPRSSEATKWPTARGGFLKGGGSAASGVLKRARSDVGESQSQRTKRASRATQLVEVIKQEPEVTSADISGRPLIVEDYAPVLGEVSKDSSNFADIAPTTGFPAHTKLELIPAPESPLYEEEEEAIEEIEDLRGGELLPLKMEHTEALAG